MARVLIVEDEDACRYAAKKALTDAGHEVVAASGYLKALEVICADEPLDLLLSDIVHPNGVNGFALARMARMRRPELKIMYMTGYDLPQDEALGKVLKKPLLGQNLVDEVRGALEAAVAA